MGSLVGTAVRVPRGWSIFAAKAQIAAALILSIPLCLIAPGAGFAVPIAITCVGDTCPGALLSATTAPLFMPPVFESPTGQTLPILPPGLTVVPGDVLVYDDPSFTDLGDVLRFTGTAYILYSDPGDPADTGIPILQSNQFSGLEDPSGTIIYTVIGSLGTVTYTAVSDGATPDIPTPPPSQAPEPATLLLFASALAGYAAMRHRQKTS
ncbi:MAG TPA: PEP-CTERM sorting domain-containing protein [Micropepsaceae bacterium]|nr:PEP-CTERM sorting domain-containing protein [Micropepsaceae bacterium]